jgi:DNA-binding transcriptional LysR family regulator
VFFDGRIGGDVEQVKVLDDPYVVVSRLGDLPNEPVPLAALHEAPMVAPPPICDQARVEKMYAEAGIAPRIVFRTADNRGLLSMVRAGLGLAVMPRLSLEFLDEELNTHEPVPAIAPREIYLGWKADRTLSPLARQVIDVTLEVAAGYAAGSPKNSKSPARSR